jgi:hypothetical protein
MCDLKLKPTIVFIYILYKEYVRLTLCALLDST